MLDTTKHHLHDAKLTLDKAYQNLSGVAGASHWLNEVKQLRGRIEKQQKTVAVFGAFSAGKSSLINALIGDSVLAVSPNPTTATVSHIIPEDEGNRGTAHVVAKTSSQMWDDVSQAFAGMHRTPNSLEEAAEMASSLSLAGLAPSARRGASFLKAVSSGYEAMKNHLGSEWDIDSADTAKYTADEKHACYLQRVDIPHSVSALNDANVVLVDTPGVDSIHRRHTEVTFRYMRQADAIVFVLYYTHAFSRADKDFMLQLAGVQDVAHINKLFVVINAVDLATSEDERRAVRDRVEKELRGLGIRQPRVYEMSAQIAFAAERLKQNPGDPQIEQLVRQRLKMGPGEALPSADTLLEGSGLPTFANALSHYMEEQSEHLLLGAVSRLMEGSAKHVQSVLQTKRLQASADAALRGKQIDGQKAYLASLEDSIRKVEAGGLESERGLRAEWDELIFHITERIRLRFPGLFRETYNPGRFRQGMNPRVGLSECAAELGVVMGKQVELECRTFGLRVEALIRKSLEHDASVLRERLNELSVIPLDVGLGDIELVEQYPPFQAEVSPQVFAAGAKHFRNAKQYFEEGGQAQMLADIEPVAIQSVRAEVERLTGGFVTEAIQAYRHRIEAEYQAACTAVGRATDEMQNGISEEELAHLAQVNDWFRAETNAWKENA